jgi:hypothetical protein
MPAVDVRSVWGALSDSGPCLRCVPGEGGACSGGVRACACGLG